MFLTLPMLALALLVLFGPAPYLLETRASLYEESEPTIFCRECYTGIMDPRLSLLPNIGNLASLPRTGFSSHEPGDSIKSLAEMEKVKKLNPQETKVVGTLEEPEVDHQEGVHSHWARSAFQN